MKKKLKQKPLLAARLRGILRTLKLTLQPFSKVLLRFYSFLFIFKYIVVIKLSFERIINMKFYKKNNKHASFHVSWILINPKVPSINLY